MAGTDAGPGAANHDGPLNPEFKALGDLIIDPSIPLDRPLYTDKKPKRKFYETYMSQAHRLQRTRSTPVIHGDLHEPLTRYKSL